MAAEDKVSAKTFVDMATTAQDHEGPKERSESDENAMDRTEGHEEIAEKDAVNDAPTSVVEGGGRRPSKNNPTPGGSTITLRNRGNLVDYKALNKTGIKRKEDQMDDDKAGKKRKQKTNKKEEERVLGQGEKAPEKGREKLPKGEKTKVKHLRTPESPKTDPVPPNPDTNTPTERLRDVEDENPTKRTPHMENRQNENEQQGQEGEEMEGDSLIIDSSSDSEDNPLSTSSVEAEGSTSDQEEGEWSDDDSRLSPPRGDIEDLVREGLKNENERLKGENKEARDEIDRLERKIDKYRRKAEEGEKNAEDNLRRAEESERENRRTQGVLEKTEDMLHARDKEIKKLKEEVKEIKKLREETKEIKKLREEVKKLRRDKDKASEKSGEAKDKDKEHRKKIDEQTKEHKRKLDTVKRDLNRKIDDLQHDHKAELEELKRSNAKKTEDLKEEYRQDIDACHNRIESLKKRLEESETLNKELVERITREKMEQSKVQKKQSQVRALIIGDSNSKRIVPYMDEEVTWSFSENTYIIDDICKVRPDETYDATVILMGTNNIKQRGKDGNHEARKLMEEVKKLKLAKRTLVCEIPPIKIRDARLERRLFNATIKSMAKEVGCEVIKTPEDTEYEEVGKALEDDLHLNADHAKKLAEEIGRAVKENHQKETEEGQQEQITINGKPDFLRELMGREQRNAKDIGRKYNVRIWTSMAEPNSIYVRGWPEDLRDAENEIKSRLQRMEERGEYSTRKREQTRNIPCRYFASNSCDKGEKCRFKHSQEMEVWGNQSSSQGRGDRSRSRDRGSDRNTERRGPSPVRRVFIRTPLNK